MNRLKTFGSAPAVSPPYHNGSVPERRYNRTYEVRDWCWSAWPEIGFARKGID
jgi:hypothetical protein